MVFDATEWMIVIFVKEKKKRGSVWDYYSCLENPMDRGAWGAI